MGSINRAGVVPALSTSVHHGSADVQSLDAERPSLSSARNGFLDLVRSIALIRIIVWHTYGYAWISYFIASMPAMFFVAGSLMASSLRRGKALDVLYRRFRRILLPLWVMAAASLLAMAIAHRLDPEAASSLGFSQIVWWIFPLNDPSGSEWGMTLWAPMWYLRCMTWLLLASPLLVALWRRAGITLLPVPLIVLASLEIMAARGIASPPWQVQDAVLFSFFWLMGFAYSEGSFASIRTPARAAVAVGATLCAVVWSLTHDIPGGIVNTSYPLHLFVGLAWLFAALSLEGALGRISSLPRVAPVLYWMNQRAMSVYLWQSFGLLAMYQLLWTGNLSVGVRDLLALPIVVSVTFVAVLMFGWVEDIAAGRAPTLWPRRQSGENPKRQLDRRLIALTGSVAVVGAVAVALAATSVARNPSQIVHATADTVPPSGAGLHLRAQKAMVHEGPPIRPVTGISDPVLDEELQTELEAWLADWNISGATTTIRRENGDVWTGAAGFRDTGEAFVPNEPYWVASVTKTFTAALIMRLAEMQYLGLDDPVSWYVPDFDNADRFTVRQLLQHTSGLISGYELPFDALQEASTRGVQFEPGTAYMYSRAGYYLLGMVIEDVLGDSFTSVLHQQILDPLALSSTWMDEEIAPMPYSTHPYLWDISEYEEEAWTATGHFLERRPVNYDYHGVLWSAGGLWSTTSDLTRWGLALWGSNVVLSEPSRQQITTFLDADFDFTGIGTYPFCACWREDGVLQAERWGFAGTSGILEYDPVDRVALAIHMNGTLFDENVIDALEDLSMRLRKLIRERPMQTNDFLSPFLQDLPGDMMIYTIEEGDTLTDIATRLGIDPDSIQDWIQRTLDINGLEDENALHAGQDLQIPE